MPARAPALALILALIAGLLGVSPPARAGSHAVESDDRVELHLADQTYAFTADETDTWAPESVSVRGVKTSEPLTASDGFFDGAGRADGYTLSESGGATTLTFAGSTFDESPDSPSVIVDDGEPGYTETGSWATSNVTTGYNGSSRFSTQSGATAAWSIDVAEAGQSNIYAYLQNAGGETTSAATYTIEQGDFSRTATVDQRRPEAGWVRLASGELDDDAPVTVTLEVAGGGVHRADAVRVTRADIPTPWTVAYTADSAEALPAVHVAIDGVAHPRVAHRTVDAAEDQRGAFLTRGAFKADASNTNAYVDATTPIVLGHSKAGAVDAAYVVIPDFEQSIPPNSKSAQVTGTEAFSGRLPAGDGRFHGTWGVNFTGDDEPTSFRIVIDRDLGRVNTVGERYYADAVNSLVDLEELELDARVGDATITNVPVRWSNPEAYTPGWGWRMGEDNAEYPSAHLQSTLNQGVAMQYQGLATGRDWERDFSGYVMDSTPLVGEPGEAYMIRDERGAQTWTTIGTYAQGFPVRPTAAHNSLWNGGVRQLYNYGKVSGDDAYVDLAIDLVRFDADVKLDLDAMRFPRTWDPRTDEPGPVEPVQESALLAAFPWAAITAYRETGDEELLAKADQVLDHFIPRLAAETQFEVLAPQNRTSWHPTSVGNMVLALLDRHERSGDEELLEIAKDLAWMVIMWHGTVPDFAGVSVAGIRGTLDYDVRPFAVHEQHLPLFVIFGPLLDHVEGSAYATFLALAQHGMAEAAYPSLFGVDMRGTILGNLYGSEARIMANLMYYLNASSDDQVIALEKLVSDYDPQVTRRRDAVVANGTTSDRSTEVALRYLDPGRYRVSIDGRRVPGTRTHEDLAAGVGVDVAANSMVSLQVEPVVVRDRPAPPARYDDTTTYLSDLPDRGASRGAGGDAWQPVYGVDESVESTPISVGGVVYDRGIGMGSSTAAVWELGGDYATFAATVGVDDVVADRTPDPTVEFTLFVDGELAFDSGVMNASSTPQDVEVDVRDAEVIVLRMSHAYDNNGQGRDDLGAWADARLEGSRR